MAISLTAFWSARSVLVVVLQYDCEASPYSLPLDSITKKWSKNTIARRKRTIDRKKVIALHGQGIGATDIAKQPGIGRSTVNKVLREANE